MTTERSGEREVLIAGAGPAGIATAVAIVRADRSLAGRVLVVDRARFPRSKPCGGGLTGHVEEAMRALGLTLTVPSFPSPRAIVKYGSFERTVELARPVRTVRREEFDASLVEQARALGVEVREGAALGAFAVDDGGVTATVSGDTIRARVLVGADGAGSLVRKALDESGDSDRVARARSDDKERNRARPIRLFRAELPDQGRLRDEMLYDFTPMVDGLRGYLWIFPVPGGRLNVGVMHDPSAAHGMTGATLASLCAARLRDHGVTLPAGALRGWPAWGYERTRRIAAARVLTVGDAAGIDALTGEGIAVALEQGLVAGRAVLRALASGDVSFASFGARLARSTIGRELSLDGLLARLLYGGADHRAWLSLVLHDPRMLELYAARVSGTTVLSSRPFALAGAFARHLVSGRARLRATRAFETTDGRPSAAAAST